VLISESPVGNYRRRKTPGLCLVEALPGEVVALGISMCDTTRDGSRIVANQEVIRFLPDCPSSAHNLASANKASKGAGVMLFTHCGPPNSKTPLGVNSVVVRNPRRR